ncbi:hypothetical protein BOX15_Mlig033832g1 [Macrostomum lignano]|nr:hypothetical protein BOX15_Mlig033832g1 [Macrostomum lignano]
MKLFLFLRDSKIGFVESFGFSKAKTALGALRLFFKLNRGALAWKPGDLIEAEHSLPEYIAAELASMVQRLLDFASQKVTDDPRNSDIMNRPGTIRNQEISADESHSIRAPEGHQETTANQKALEDSPLCHLCQTRSREVLLLPCKHLLYCKRCISGFRVCPACNCKITAEKQAYMP